jgi:hypothetical protein
MKKDDHQKGPSRKNTANIGGAAYAPQQDEPHSKGDERKPELSPSAGVLSANRRERRMAKHRGGRVTRSKHEDDLQRDGRGAGHAAPKGNKELDKELDNTLEDSFPSSDPPAISQPTKTEPAGDPKVKP